jgi:hypothetical protein
LLTLTLKNATNDEIQNQKISNFFPHTIKLDVPTPFFKKDFYIYWSKIKGRPSCSFFDLVDCQKIFFETIPNNIFILCETIPMYGYALR